MNIQPFNRSHITRRQLERQLDNHSEAARVLDKFTGDNVGDLSRTLSHRIDKHTGDLRLRAGLTAGLSAAALAAGAFNLGLGLAVGAVAGVTGFASMVSLTRRIAAQDGLAAVNELAAKTEKSLVEERPDGSVVDRRFLDQHLFHAPQEVRGANGDVLSRSIRVEYSWAGGPQQELTAAEDVRAGTVTLRGELGEGTFPGSIHLPTASEPELSIKRTDQQGLNPELVIIPHSDCRVRITDGDLQHASRRDYSGMATTDGLIFLKNNQLAVQCPVSPNFMGHLSYPRDGVPFDLGHGVQVECRLDAPALEPLQVVELEGRLPVVKASFQYLTFAQAGQNVTIADERAGTSWSVPGSLTPEGDVLMTQGDLSVRQTFEWDKGVELQVGDTFIHHQEGHPPTADTLGIATAVAALDDGSYSIGLRSGSARIRPAVTLEQLGGSP